MPVQDRKGGRMDTFEIPSERRPSMKERLVFSAVFSAAYSLTTISLANLYLWQKEIRNRFVHYSMKSIETLDGVYPVVFLAVPRPPRETKVIEAQLHTAQDWRTLREFMAAEIRIIADEVGTLAQAEAMIQEIERQAEPEHHHVTDTVRRETRLSAHA